MSFIHFDEARTAAEERARAWVDAQSDGVRAVLVVDLFGRLRFAVWAGQAKVESADAALAPVCGPWWAGSVNAEDADDVTRQVFESAWEGAVGDSRFRVMDRHRTRTAWFRNSPPAWRTPSEGPPVIVFYSFKGGLGRSTLLASFAIQRANAGDRVCVLDFDLDSPGVGSLLSANPDGTTAAWGIVDFLVERPAADVPLSDYYHRCDRVAGSGEILVFPAGRLNEQYVSKLARVDFDERAQDTSRGIDELLARIRTEISPQWVLLDARTGLSDPSGALLSGLAHLHVLLGTPQAQSWLGLGRVLDRLGRARIERDESQAEVLMVHAMVPPGGAGRVAVNDFLARAEQEFSTLYYLEAPEDGAGDDRAWDMGDAESLDAPHRAATISYREALASFGDIREVQEALGEAEYRAFAARLIARFPTEEP